MKLKTVNLAGKGVILMLWLMALLTLVYVLEEGKPRGSISYYFNKLEESQPESPKYPPRWIESVKGGENYTKNYSSMIPYHEQLFDGYIVRLEPTHVKINSDGFRDREFSLEKPIGTFRIIMLGDSLVFGQGVELNNSLPKQLEFILNTNQNNLAYEVLNLGVQGQNTFGEVELFKDEGLKYNPDMVIIIFCNNDIQDELLTRELYLNFTKEYHDKGLNPEDYSLEIHRKVLQLIESKIEHTPFNENWKIVEGPLEDLVSVTQKRNIPLMIFSLEGYSFEDADNALSNFANKNNDAYFAQALINTKSYKDEELILHPLDAHPTPLAYTLYAEKIYETLIKQGLIPYNQK